MPGSGVLAVSERSVIGVCGHGFCLGPITGEILADLAVEGATAHPIDAFARSRFASGVNAEHVTLHG